MIKRYYIVVKNRERTELIRFFSDKKKGNHDNFSNYIGGGFVDSNDERGVNNADIYWSRTV